MGLIIDIKNEFFYLQSILCYYMPINRIQHQEEMTMNLRLTNEMSTEDLKKIHRLNQEAFIEEQRVPYPNMVKLLTSNQIHLLAVYDEETFVGFFLTAANEKTVYIFFFAVESKFRSKGYGSKALALLTDYYPNQQIVLDLEKIEKKASNNAQRISRKNFYIRNGYKETGFQLAYDGMGFEIMCTKSRFDKDAFIFLLNQITPVLNTIRKEPLKASIISLR